MVNFDCFYILLIVIIYLGLIYLVLSWMLKKIKKVGQSYRIDQGWGLR